jgi:polyhydroxybutyrate depolymerase
MTPRRAGLALAACAITVASCSSSPPRAAPPPESTTAPASTVTLPDCTRPHEPGHATETFTFDNQERMYRIYVPPAYDGTQHVPLVFNFHGFGSNAFEQMAYGNFVPLADRDNFIIVAPEGQGAPQHFNLLDAANEQNDLRMTPALLDHLENELCIDPRRVYSTGMSNGGAMSSVLGCTMGDRLAAIAPVAVVISSEIACRESRPMPIAAFMGTDDPVVPFDGGKVNCCGGATLKSAPEAMAGWAEHNDCAEIPDEERIGSDVRKHMWRDCAPGADTIFYIIDGGGHTWPGGIHVDRLGTTTDTIKASDVIWDFFKRHAL